MSTEPEAQPAEIAPLFQVVKGNPTDEDIAALVTVLASASGGGDAGRPERNLWGHPVSKLRYAHTSWQLVTLVERTFMRR